MQRWPLRIESQYSLGFTPSVLHHTCFITFGSKTRTGCTISTYKSDKIPVNSTCFLGRKSKFLCKENSKIKREKEMSTLERTIIFKK